jgi:hypothetical protein
MRRLILTAVAMAAALGSNGAIIRSSGKELSVLALGVSSLPEPQDEASGPTDDDVSHDDEMLQRMEIDTRNARQMRQEQLEETFRRAEERITLKEVRHEVRGRWITKRKAQRARAEQIEELYGQEAREAKVAERRRREAKLGRRETLRQLRRNYRYGWTPTLETVLADLASPTTEEITDRQCNTALDRAERRYEQWRKSFDVTAEHEHGTPGARDECVFCEQGLPNRSAFLPVIAAALKGEVQYLDDGRPSGVVVPVAAVA